MNVLIAVVGAFLYRYCEGSQPEVTIRQGTVRGLYSESIGGRTYSSFIGIPYARPPVGKHRFKESVSAEPWIGIYNATRTAPACLQLHHRFLQTPFAIQGSEDCLYLNVFTPKIWRDELRSESTSQANQTKPFDVIALIHGGAFMYLSSAMFGASILLDRDIVLVTINYRLGPLGFLSTGDATVPGNNGMKDQVLALKWIRQNIAAFGGDPDKVTIAGFSAGGASVYYHMLSPLSKGLFKSAMCISGTSLNPWTFAENSREKAFHVGRQLGCPTNDSLSMIKCLRYRPAQHIVDISRNFMPWLYNPFSPYALVVEPPNPNAFLPDYPINIIKSGNATDVPVLFTFAKEEGLYPGAELAGKEKNLLELKTRWTEVLAFVLDYNNTTPPQRTTEEISRRIKEYYNVDLDTKQGVANLIKLLGDRLFVSGISKTAKLHASLYKSPVYVYRFSYSGKYTLAANFGGNKEMGVSHADDIMYVFSMPGLSPYETESDKRMSKNMVDMWISFAMDGKLEGPEVNKTLPKLAFTDVQGPDRFVQYLVDELGEETFWNSFDLLENVESSIENRDEL